MSLASRLQDELLAADIVALASLFIVVGMVVGAVWPEHFSGPVKGRLIRPPPDCEPLMTELARRIKLADHEMHESEMDQVYVDIALLICERVGHGVFYRGSDQYYCLQDGEVMFAHSVGKEMFWWSMQDFGLVPSLKHAKATKPGATPPWVAYEP